MTRLSETMKARVSIGSVLEIKRSKDTPKCQLGGRVLPAGAQYVYASR